MKKFMTALGTALLVVILAVCFAGCDKGDNVKKAFEDNGYTVESVKADDSRVKGLFALVGLTDEQIDKIAAGELIICFKGASSAAVVKFPSSGDLKDFFTVEKDGEKDTHLYDEAKNDGLINGNCYIITISDSAKEIFRKA